VNLLANIFESSKRQGNIIKNEDVLNYEYVPKILPFREGQVQEIAESIKPMLDERKGTNLFIFGAPGIGKTASIKWVLRELDEHTDEIIPLYVNCWNLKTKYFIFMEMANKLKISFIAGKSAEHVLQQLVYRLKDKKIVFVFDEVDKAEDSDFLYQIIESFPKSTILLASNVRDYTINMDPRIKSRMMIRSLEFKPYTISEINKILSERVKFALKSDVLDPSLIKQISNVTYNKGDIRVGLFILREAAKAAESKSKKRIEEGDVLAILRELENATTTLADEERLTKDESMILDVIKEFGNDVAGTIYEHYAKKGGLLSYRSFKRYIERLVNLGILKSESTSAGFRGQSSRISIV